MGSAASSDPTAADPAVAAATAAVTAAAAAVNANAPPEEWRGLAAAAEEGAESADRLRDSQSSTAAAAAQSQRKLRKRRARLEAARTKADSAAERLSAVRDGFIASLEESQTSAVGFAPSAVLVKLHNEYVREDWCRCCDAGLLHTTTHHYLGRTNNFSPLPL